MPRSLEEDTGLWMSGASELVSGTKVWPVGGVNTKVLVVDFIGLASDLESNNLEQKRKRNSTFQTAYTVAIFFNWSAK